MKNYRCSVFCPIYKGEKFVNGYITDMLRQTIFNDVEFIFLDCASPENERSIIEPLASEYSNIKYHRLDSDPGLYQAWNLAVDMCSSQIIGNWNLDLVYGITYVSTVANETYEQNSYDIIYPCIPHSLENLFLNNSPHCMPLWKKSLHDRFGYFDVNYRTASDGDMWLRCAIGGAKIKMVNHPVGLYYYNPTGKSTDPQFLTAMVAEVQEMRRKHKSKLETNSNG
jgi:glycosyltransferase involved in cell wall biosynthesis